MKRRLFHSIARDAPNHRAWRGFTLVELLVVVAIIAVLIGILLPTLTRVQDQVRLTSCLANLRTLGQAHRIYGNDYRDQRVAMWVTFVPRRTVSYDYDNVSPDVRRRGQVFGQGVLVEQYLKGKFDVLLCPSLDLQVDVQIDRDNWQANAVRSGSSYAYFYRENTNPVDGRTATPTTFAGLTFTQAAKAKWWAMAMDIAAEEGHTYTGQYEGRAWVNHRRLRKSNILYLDGSAATVSSKDVTLQYPGGDDDEVTWFAKAHKTR
jgi:prepilin-type N-terminal cleavage/methylation domain-containing protein/prepilin-type processing-associated H-X9-DG protein